MMDRLAQHLARLGRLNMRLLLSVTEEQSELRPESSEV